MDGSSTNLEFRSGYLGDRNSFAALADLLRDTFDIDIGLLDRFGGPNPASMPFGYFDAEGRCVANFSAFSMPLQIDGNPVRAVGYQSGAVRPEYRGRGLYRDVMGRAFAWATKQDFELGILLTDKPSLYAPYGFVSLPQHAFHGEILLTHLQGTRARLLSLDNQADVDLVSRLLSVRRPVSECFSVRTEAQTFLLNACFDADVRLSHLPDSDVVVAWKHGEDGLFQLLDIVGAEIPALIDIVAALGLAVSKTRVCFPPDRLDWPDGKPERHFGACELMVANMRNIDLPRKPFMLSPMADF